MLCYKMKFINALKLDDYKGILFKSREEILKTFNKIMLAISLMGLMTNSVWAANASFNFSVTPIAENVYSIVSPSLGLHP